MLAAKVLVIVSLAFSVSKGMTVVGMLKEVLQKYYVTLQVWNSVML